MTCTSSNIFERDLHPPTPPTDVELAQDVAINEALEYLNVDFSLPNTKPSIAGLDTPPKSSPTNQPDSTSREKKVGFRSWTVQHNGPSPKKSSAELRPLPQIRKAKPLKSILKLNASYTPTPEEEQFQTTGYFSPEKPVSVPKMLESIIQSLASSDPLIRLDGYRTLNGALKAYSNFPHEEALRDRMPQLQAFILRDVKLSPGDGRNSNLITQALKLCISLFPITGLAPSISNEFRAALLDAALNLLGNEVLNKAVANHFVYLLASPDFRPRTLTAAKADLLLTRLDGITNRVSGNSVNAGRLTIYLRLIEQVPTVMLTKIRTWIEHIFHGCLSSHEDVCRRAVECGLRAGLEFGTHYNAQKAVVDIFATETTDGRTYGNYFVNKLSDMVVDASRGPLVPRIWSVIILFFRNYKRPISSWQTLKPLLRVLQKCLNSSDVQIRYQATIAWNRLVYVAGLDTVNLAPMDMLVAMLNVPFSTAFGQQINHAKNAIELRKTAHLGFANLLYYALQPSQNFDRLDIFWNKYAASLLPRMLKTGDLDGNFANRALKALFYDGAKAWNSEKANVPPEIKVEELPRLDPNWLRTRLPNLLSTFESYFGASLCITSAGPDVYETPWRQLVFAIADAGAQEVRTSIETREALAHLMNFLRRIWTTAVKWVKDMPSKTFIGHFGKMLNLCIEAFGTVVFLEDNIAVDQMDLVQPAPTPSNRLSKHGGRLQSPFHFLMKMLCAPHDTLTDQEVLVEVVESLLELVLQGQTSLTARLSLLRHCLPGARYQLKEQEQTSAVIISVADIIMAATASFLGSDHEQESRPPQYGQIARHTTMILVDYLKIQNSDDLSTSWTDAFNALAAHFFSLGGETLVHLGLVDSLIAALQDDTDDLEVGLLVRAATIIFAKATWIKSRHQVDNTMKILGVSQLEHLKKTNPLEKNYRLLKFADSVLQKFYGNSDSCHPSGIELLKLINSYLLGCPSDLVSALFQHVSPGCANIIEDRENKFAQGAPSYHAMREQSLILWEALLSHISSLPVDTQVLKTVECILVAGFRSRNITIVNSAIQSWNTSFGLHSELSYPQDLVPILCELAKHDVQIELPALAAELADIQQDFSIKLPAFSGGTYEQEEDDQDAHNNALSTPHVPQGLLISGLPEGQTPMIMTASSTTSRTHTPKSKALVIPKFRHDNSQIEFVSIENLPSELMQDESQGLTEHQKEVKERQQLESAAIFGQFSSSPLPSSTTKNLIVNRVRERLEIDALGGRLSTPEVLEDQALIDESLGSSPSAQSAQRAQSRSSRQGSSPPARMRQPVFDEHDEDDIDDIPSSPPEQPDDFVFNAENVFGEESNADRGEETVVDVKDVEAGPQNELTGVVVDHLPGEEQEEVPDEAAVESGDDAGLPHNLVAAKDCQDQDPEAFAPQPADMQTGEVPIEQERSTVPDPSEIDISRVEDSFVDEIIAVATTSDQRRGGDSEAVREAEPVATPKRTRKRRSPDSATPTSESKRQKGFPPFRQLFSRFMGGKNVRRSGDDEMEDCIVVATQPDDTADEDDETEVEHSVSQPESSAAATKRGKGRPRRTTNGRTVVAEDPAPTPTPAPAPPPARGIKRKSSRLSSGIPDTQSRDEEAATTTHKQTPRKVRRNTRSQDAKSGTEVIDEDPSPKVESPAETPSIESGIDVGGQVDGVCSTPEGQLRHEMARVEAVERPTATPWSILERLRGILADVTDMGKKFVLGSPEQIEISGVLFELGGQVHAAGQRGTE
ncbi:hypothetical protein ANO11243_064330 [Dothideomycetidae sp. 11243]|nr:hypothetical protein ANO11243_064330 [fungal sp. No.11243]